MGLYYILYGWLYELRRELNFVEEFIFIAEYFFNKEKMLYNVLEELIYLCQKESLVWKILLTWSL